MSIFMETYASTFEDELAALEKELEKGTQKAFLEMQEEEERARRVRLTRVKKELEDVGLVFHKARRPSRPVIRYVPKRLGPTTERTPEYRPTPITVLKKATIIQKPRVTSVVKVPPGALPQLNEALRRLRFQRRPTVATITTNEVAATAETIPAAPTTSAPAPTILPAINLTLASPAPTQMPPMETATT